jgi:hypothetical protein
MRYLSAGVALLLVAGNCPPAGLLMAVDGEAQSVVFRPGVDGVTDPVKRWAPAPGYPEAMRQKNLEAEVALVVIVTKDGTVKLTPNVMCQVSRHGKGPKKRLQRHCPAFVAEAQRAVRWWLFDPAERNDDPVDAFYTVVIHFTLL